MASAYNSSDKRKQADLMKLMMSDYHVEMNNDDMKEFFVRFYGPSNNLNHVFDIFLPVFLDDPNAEDPLNGDAAALLIHDPVAYKDKVKEYCERYAKPEDVGVVPEDESSDEEPSEDDDDSGDEATPSAGPVNP